MDRDTSKLALALGALALGIFAMMSGGAIERPPGVLIDRPPVQHAVDEPLFPLGNYQLEPKARFEIDARVLGVERYRFDGGSDISPIDFALGWGPMSDSAVLSHFRIEQGARFSTIYPDEGAIDLQIALTSAANMHLIPATERIHAILDQVRPGELVYLRGRLVNVHGPNGYRWNTSLTRTDSGAGACEVFYVEHVERK